MHKFKVDAGNLNYGNVTGWTFCTAVILYRPSYNRLSVGLWDKRARKCAMCVKSFITIGWETTNPWGIENLLTILTTTPRRNTTARTSLVHLETRFRVQKLYAKNPRLRLYHGRLFINRRPWSLWQSCRHSSGKAINRTDSQSTIWHVNDEIAPWSQDKIVRAWHVFPALA